MSKPSQESSTPTEPAAATYFEKIIGLLAFIGLVVLVVLIHQVSE